MKKIAVIIGSLRKESWNRKMALEVMKLAPASLNMEIVDIGELPLYNQDLDETPPQAWVTFRERMKSFDAFLFFSPEYNRSIPAPLKNAIDVGSRPYGASIWSGKPGAIISCSPGAIGGFGANHHLRQSFVFLDIFCMPQPEAYMSNVAQLFYENGHLAKEDTKGFLQKYLQTFEKWVHDLS